MQAILVLTIFQIDIFNTSKYCHPINFLFTTMLLTTSKKPPDQRLLRFFLLPSVTAMQTLLLLRSTTLFFMTRISSSARQEVMRPSYLRHPSAPRVSITGIGHRPSRHRSCHVPGPRGMCSRVPHVFCAFFCLFFKALFKFL